MTCHHCGFTFNANYQVNCAPGGQESPGTFLVLGMLFAIAGAIHEATVGTIWQWFSYCIAGFVWLQCGVALTDCWRTLCPNCRKPTRVRPWSF